MLRFRKIVHSHCFKFVQLAFKSQRKQNACQTSAAHVSADLRLWSCHHHTWIKIMPKLQHNKCLRWAPLTTCISTVSIVVYCFSLLQSARPSINVPFFLIYLFFLKGTTRNLHIVRNSEVFKVINSLIIFPDDVHDYDCFDYGHFSKHGQNGSFQIHPSKSRKHCVLPNMVPSEVAGRLQKILAPNQVPGFKRIWI